MRHKFFCPKIKRIMTSSRVVVIESINHIFVFWRIVMIL